MLATQPITYYAMIQIALTVYSWLAHKISFSLITILALVRPFVQIDQLSDDYYMFWQLGENRKELTWFSHSTTFPLFSNFQPTFTVQLWAGIIWYQNQGLLEKLMGWMRGEEPGVSGVNIIAVLTPVCPFFLTTFQLLNSIQNYLGHCQYPVDFGDDCPETSLRRFSGEAEEKNEEELHVSKVSAFAVFSLLLSPSFATFAFFLDSCSRASLPPSPGFSLAFVVFFTESVLPAEVVRLSKAPEYEKLKHLLEQNSSSCSGCPWW